MKEKTREELLKIRDAHESWLLEQPYFEGLGIARNDKDQLCLTIYVNRDLGETEQDSIKDVLQEAPVMFELTSRMQAIDPRDSSGKTDE